MHSAGVDYVIHQAAIPSVPRSVEDPIGTNLANVNGTLNVLVAARDAKVKRVVYASSSSLYGDVPTLPKSEDMAPSPDFPLCSLQIDRRILHAFVLPRVWIGDGLVALLQRFRTVSGSDVDVLWRAGHLHQPNAQR